MRLTRGEYGRVDVYGEDAADFARRWVQEGARRLHVVDLDGAKSGAPSAQNLAVVEQIVRASGIAVQFGGGLRTRADMERLLALGVDRIILGTSAAVDLELVRHAARDFGERLAVGVDARKGMIALRGWTEQTDRRAVDFAQEMERAGVRRIVFTDIGRDGTLEGPNLAALTEVARSVGIAVVASGGVGTLEDIQLLAARAPANVDSVIVGKALYAGGMSLRDALRAAAHGGLDGEQ